MLHCGLQDSEFSEWDTQIVDVYLLAVMRLKAWRIVVKKTSVSGLSRSHLSGVGDSINLVFAIVNRLRSQSGHCLL